MPDKLIDATYFKANNVHLFGLCLQKNGPPAIQSVQGSRETCSATLWVKCARANNNLLMLKLMLMLYEIEMEINGNRTGSLT